MISARLLRRPGVDIAYERTGPGHGPRVVFIQGVGASGEAWRPQVRELSREMETLWFDHRGIGRSHPCRGPVSIESMAEDVTALMDEAGWESAYLVGHSMGGLVAQQVALQGARRVCGLALLCTFSRGGEAARITPWVLWMTLRTRIGTRRMRRRAFLEMLLPPQELSRRDEGALAAEVGGMVGRDLADSPSILMRQLRAMSRHDAFGRLRELGGLPALVISATLDPIARPQYGRRLAGAIPGADYEEIPGASHGVTMFCSERINALLRSFVHAAELRRRTAS